MPDFRLFHIIPVFTPEHILKKLSGNFLFISSLYVMKYVTMGKNDPTLLQLLGARRVKTIPNPRETGPSTQVSHLPENSTATLISWFLSSFSHQKIFPAYEAPCFNAAMCGLGEELMQSGVCFPALLPHSWCLQAISFVSLKL